MKTLDHLYAPMLQVVWSGDSHAFKAVGELASARVIHAAA